MDKLLFLQGRDIPRCRCHSRVSLELVEVELISLSLPPLSPLFYPLLLPVPSLVTVIQTQRPRFWWCQVRTMQSAFGSRFSLDDDGWVRSSLPYLGSTGSYFSPMAFSGCFLPPPSLYPLRRQDDPYDTASFILDFLKSRARYNKEEKKKCLGCSVVWDITHWRFRCIMFAILVYPPPSFTLPYPVPCLFFLVVDLQNADIIHTDFLNEVQRVLG